MATVSCLNASQARNFFSTAQQKYPKLDLAVLECRAFMRSKGKDSIAQRFLLDVVTSDAVNRTGFLFIALKDVGNELEKRQLVQDILEYAYACLDLFIDNLRFDDKWKVRAIADAPPYPGFLTGAEEKKYALLNNREP